MTYRLDELGWFQFERLCQALLKAALGPAVEAWSGPGDWGRDAYAAGALRFPDPEESHEGPFVFQVKFVEGANAAGASPREAIISAVRREQQRIRHRMEEGQWSEPAVYTLLTNAPLAADLRGEIASLLKEVIRNGTVVCLGEADLSTWLDSYPRVRVSYPQILGLRDLEHLVSRAVAAHTAVRSAAWLAEAQELTHVFVPTTAYYKALDVLREHRFVVLMGPPEMGKTAIATMIALAQASTGWDAFECREPSEVLRLYGRERQQAFVADDAFGSTEYRPDIAQEWGQDLPRMLRLMNKNHWIIFTSRPGPLNEALRRLHLQGEATEFPSPGRVAVDASRLSMEEKALMLYRHAKQANLGDEVKEGVRGVADGILRSRHFTPLRIQRLARELRNLPANGNLADAIEEAIRKGLQESTPSMRSSFAALSDEHKGLLYAMLNFDAGPIRINELRGIMERYHSSSLEVSVSDLAADLGDHFVRHVSRSDVDLVDWIHPTTRDVVIQYLMTHDSDRERFLKSATISGIALAFSSAGGEGGTLEFPFADSEHDWTALRDRMLAVMTEGTDDERVSLMTLLDAALKTDSLRGDRAERLRDLSRDVLTQVDAVWGNRAFSNSELSTIYELSVTAGTMIHSPDLQSTWESRAAAALQDVDNGADDLGSRRALLELLELLSHYEPRFLMVMRLPKSLTEWAERLLTSMEEYVSELLVLDPEEETESYADEVSVTLRTPVEPDWEEVSNREWLEEASQIIDPLERLFPPLADRLDALRSSIEDHHWVREERKERWEAFESYEPDEDYSDYKISRAAKDTKIEELFSDL